MDRGACNQDQQRSYHPLLRRYRWRRGRSVLFVSNSRTGGNPEADLRDSKFSQYPKITYDAYSLIQMIVDSAADSMFILDCFLQTRLTKKWKASGRTVEVISSGQVMQDTSGHTIEHSHGFTFAMVKKLSEWVTHNKYKAPTSIPLIMRHNKAMHSNPQRTWNNKTAAGKKEDVKRIMLSHKEAQQNQKLVFFRTQIQGARDQGAASLQVIEAMVAEAEAKEEVEDEEIAGGRDEKAGYEKSEATVLDSAVGDLYGFVDDEMADGTAPEGEGEGENGDGEEGEDEDEDEGALFMRD